jgi:hypothetical protein
MSQNSGESAQVISPSKYRLFKLISLASTTLAVVLGGLAWSLHADKQKIQQGQFSATKQQAGQDKAAAQKRQNLPTAITEKREKFDSCMAAATDGLASASEFELEWIEYCLDD